MPEADNKVTPGQVPDPLAVYLAAAGERWNAAGNGTWEDHATALELLSSALRSAADVPRLLGAVQIALKQHRPVPAVRLVPCEEHKHWRGSLVGVPEFGQEFETENLRVRRACPDCQVFDEPYCRACVDDDRTYQDWPCKPYRDITAELLKTEGT